ncbi:hypothetical protein COS81_02235 [candidate division WWE3 bacterium CG06_land_8_20_14_3_00_42_16]|uniref:Peptidase A2 domain-containing protein n=1 Tax=candidate division WWE3 bacterium CG06_land_8_20_14_3_00_42_16 TaxID=1975083 RepID=A0A2M7ANF3_UNCKA|nr:MAG: hypothetical protein AUJ38_00200 [bacterium CG1_02_42_9]PIU68905.1 MAG: hypothetical protein COS81_02235 [candidate division WWE3 bacterium CG06_land_8_20_14_3_00_42_16]
MRSLTFPYLEYRGHKTPIIPLALKIKNEWKETIAYVDSGATYSIFKVEEAERFGLNYKTGQKEWVVVGNGSYMPIFLHCLPIKIGDEEFWATIAFSPNLGAGFNLIGRKDIFTHFDVCFSDSKATVIFTPVKKL